MLSFKKLLPKNSLLVFFAYIFLAPFLSLLAPVFSTQVLILLPIFIFLANLFLKKNRHKTNSVFTWLVLLTLFFFSLSSIHSVSISASINKLIYFIAIFATIITLSIFTNNQNLRYFVSFSIFFGTLLSLIWLILVVTGQAHHSGSNFFSLSAGHNPLSNYLVLTLSLSVSIWFGKPQHSKLLKLSIAIMLLALIFTLARGGYLAILTLPLFFIFIHKTSTIKLKKKTILLFGFLSVLIVFILGIGLKTDLNLSKVTQAKRSIQTLTQQPLNFFTRLNYWQDATQTFSKYPLFGQGLNTFDYSGRFGRTVDAHSFLLHYLADVGLPATLVLFVLILYLWLQVYKWNKHKPDAYKQAVLVATGVSFIYSLYDIGWNIDIVFISVLALLILAQPPKLAQKTSLIPLVILLTIIFFFTFSHTVSQVIAEYAQRNNSVKLYTLSLKIFPFDDSLYRQASQTSDPQNPQKSEEIINKWIKYQKGDARLYHDLSVRSLTQKDTTSSAQFYYKNLISPFNNIKDYKLFISILNQARQTKNTDALHPIIKTLDILNQRQLILNYSSDLLWRDKNQIFAYLLDIAKDIKQNTDINKLDQAKLYYYTAAGQLIRDNITQSDIELFALKATLLDPSNQLYQLLSNSISQIFSPLSTPIEIELQINEVKQFYHNHPQDTILDQVLAQLYLAKAKALAKLDKYVFSKEMDSINTAINYSPLSASVHVYKIKRLKQLGKNNAAKQALQECITTVSPQCDVWVNQFQ